MLKFLISCSGKIFFISILKTDFSLLSVDILLSDICNEGQNGVGLFDRAGVEIPL